MVHRHIIGQSGTGKTSLLVQLFHKDTTPGVCLFDTRGDLDVPHDILFDPTITRWNPLAEPINPDLAANFFAQAIKDAYGYDDLTTPVMSMYLSFVAAALIENGMNITDAPTFLMDSEFRQRCSYKTNLVKDFWDTFEGLPPKDRRTDTASTLNKFLTLLLDSRIDRLFDLNHPSFSLADVSHKTMLVRLPVSVYGKDTVGLLGSLILAYLSQLTTGDYSIYLEDTQLFARAPLLDMLSRGTHSLTLTQQYITQLDPVLFASILGNCTERHVFRVTEHDADVLSKDLPPMSSKASLDELPNYVYRTFPYDKLSPDGVTLPLESDYE